MLSNSENPESEDWETTAKENMKEWNERYCLWKNFEESRVDLVKSYVGLIICGQPKHDETENSELNIETLYRLYDSKQKSNIDKIVGQFQFENSQLNLSHTLLYLLLKDKEEEAAVAGVFRQMKFSGEVNFVDFDGRVYTSWQHFVETNKLPKCQYMAPINGIHDITTDNVEVHKSPAFEQNTLIDTFVFGASITAVGLVGLSTAPVTATILGTGSAIYGVKQSISCLIDRNEHKQSIAPTNLESAMSYLNIGTNFVYGASAVTAMKSASIIKLFGKHGNIIERVINGVHYTATASVFTNFGLHLFILQEKVRNGEASYTDLFDICVDIFLMYGAISDVRQMRSSVPNIEINPVTPPKGLSKGARRRWRKRQAKLSTTNLSNQNVTKVGAWDPKIFQAGIGIAGYAFKKLLNRHYPVITEIYQHVCMIIKDFETFFSGNISPEIFCSNIIFHCYNLYNLLQNSINEIKDTVVEFLQHHGIIASPRLVDDISNIVDDGVVAINNTIEYEEVLQEGDLDPESKPSTDAVIYAMILDVVKDLICRKEIDTPEKLLSVFTQELAFVVNEIERKISQDYENMLSEFSQLLGPEKAEILLSRMGINSKTDYANTRIEQTIESLKSSERVDVLSTIETQLNELFSLYEKLFYLLTDENISIGALKTCEILKNSIEVMIQPVTNLYTLSRKQYEIMIGYFKPKEAMTGILVAMDLDNLSVDDHDDYGEWMFLSLAIKRFNLHENKSRLFPIENTVQEQIAELISFTDIFKMETLLNICDFYAQRIGYNEKSLTKICSFVTDKFTDHFQSLANQENANVDLKKSLKLNNNVLSKNDVNKLNRFLRETNEMEIFNRVVEKFKEEDFATKLISEYYEIMHNKTDFHAEYLKHLVADDGVKMYTITMENCDNIEEFKEQAGKLFNLNMHCFDVIKKSDDLIVLKNGDSKGVVFHFGKNKTEAFVFRVDLSVQI